MTPTGPGLNHALADSARPPIMPTTARPGEMTPSVLGPTNRAPCSSAAAAIAMASQTGTRSGTRTTVFTPASMASMAADFTRRAGTKTTETSIGPPDFSSQDAFASLTVSKTGTPWTSWPPLPGVTPATTFVP